MFKSLLLALSLITLLWLSSCNRNEDKRAAYPDCLQAPTPSPLPTPTLFPSRQRYFTENWPDAEPLAFETIELENWGGGWENYQQGLLILANEIDITEAQQYISPAATQCLEGLDFNTHLGLLVFRGNQSNVHTGFKIMHLFQQNDEFIIVVHKGSPTGADAESSPYHLIRIPKSTSWQGDITFSLYFLHHDQPVLQVSHTF